jgi:putative addiction module killer protein
MTVRLFASDVFDRWISKLGDSRAKAKIQVRIDRLQRGNPGDVRPVGDGVSEMRVDFGPGYRIYFKQQGSHIILLLCGGDKASQPKDIKLAKELAQQWGAR